MKKSPTDEQLELIRSIDSLLKKRAYDSTKIFQIMNDTHEMKSIAKQVSWAMWILIIIGAGISIGSLIFYTGI